MLIAIATRDPGNAYTGAICAILGSVAGSLVLFAIARKGGEVLLLRHISSRRGARLHGWFERYGLVTVFLPALSPLPMPMKVPVFCAGALQVRWSHFIAVVLSARAVRYFALGYLGSHYGYQTVHFLLSHLPFVTALVVLLAFLSVLMLRFMDRDETPQTSSSLDNASDNR